MPTENKTIGQQRLERVINGNEFIQVIANCGRHFFRNTGVGHDAFLSMNARSNIGWLHDDYTGARINLAYALAESANSLSSIYPPSKSAAIAARNPYARCKHPPLTEHAHCTPDGQAAGDASRN